MTEFRVWAPSASTVAVVADGREQPLAPADGGWWQTTMPDLPDEVDYGFRVDNGPLRADPRGRRLPDGVHGPSRTVPSPVFTGADPSWRGIPLRDYVIYELHIGTFTQGGTFHAAIEKLDHLVALGVTAVEVLPVNGFNSVHNWGYDGVAWFAVHEPYGGPAGYRAFVDACHRKGLAVIQDVVYNHLGASGNYLPEFGPYLRDDSRNTWGQTVNLDGPGSDEVRRYILDNVRMWFADYGVDGLRLDAVHALVDARALSLLEEMSAETDALARQLGRPLSLIAESDLNDPRLVTDRSCGGLGLAGVWNDDVHHAIHVAVTGEVTGYYADFAPLGALAKVLRSGYFHDGTFSSFRGRSHGRPIDQERVRPWQLVASIQNHDQIGNRAAGDRMNQQSGWRAQAVAAVLLLTSPYTPMLFMGEEWAASTPWPFFTSHPEPDLADKTREGRFDEFARHGWDRELVPDPQDPDTFASAVLRWQECDADGHAQMLDLYRELLRLRREEIGDGEWASETLWDEDAQWITVQRGLVIVAANLAQVAQSIPLPHVDGVATVLVSTAEVSDRVRIAGLAGAGGSAVAEGSGITSAPDVVAAGGRITLPPMSAAVLRITQ